MKIAFVYDAIYPWVKGGGEKRIYEIGKILAAKGHEVHIFGVKWWDGSDIIENEGMTLHGVCDAMELYVDGRRSISEAIIFSIKLLPHLYNQNFDIIDVTAFPYFSVFVVKFISLVKRVPMVITWHEVWRDYWYEYLGWKGFFGKFIENMASKLGKSIAVSQMTKNNLGSIGKDKAVYIIPNGIDLKRVSDIKPNIDKCDIIFVGRLIKEKNVDVLLKAIDYVRHELSDIKCSIIGGGPEKEKLIKFVNDRRFSNNVTFFDFMEHDDIISRIKSSKILVLPSSREGFGMVVIEAFACGVPVITTDCERNAASELINKEINKETGFVIDLDVYKLCDTIYKLMTNEVLQKNMSKSAMTIAQEYDWDNIVNKLDVIYKGDKYK
jgi:glycosyltransferase involved in cell wall biosynthesis